MSWYNNSGPHQNPPNAMPHSHFQSSQPLLPPTTQQQQQQPAATYPNTNNQSQQQWPHQQPANYQGATGNFPGQPPPQQLQQQQPATSWNTSHGPTFFKPADMNQNFGAPPVPQPQPLSMPSAPQQQPPSNNNDGWGDWGDEWTQEAGAAMPNNNSAGVVDNYQQQHQQNQLPPPPPVQPPHPSQQPAATGNDQFYSNHQQPTMFTPANYPAPPPVTFEANPNLEPHQPPPSNVIADSFANSAGNWNWNAVDSNANQVELIRKPAVFNKMSTSAIGKIGQTTVESVPSINPYNTNQPDDMKSQHYGSQAGPEAQQPPPSFNQQTFGGEEMDPLDMALMQMNVQSEQSITPPALDNGASFFGPPQPTTGGISLPNSSFVAPAPMEEQPVENQQVVEAMQQPEVAQPRVESQFAAPPPVTATPPLPAASPALTGAPLMGMMPPPGGNAPRTSVVNPFKRCGTAVPRNTFFEPPTNAPTLPPPQPTPPPPAVQEPMLIIPPEGPPSGLQDPEPIMHANNDRNEYLQTDQLSEEIEVQNSGSAAESYDHLPPPGLSRLVLGETEDQHYSATSGAAQSVSIVTSLPPLGLNRMIPGTDLEGAAADVALQRGADGQDDDNVAVGSAYPPPSDLTDRNLYQVPGEDHQQQQQQPPPSRVVTGDENAVPFVAVQPVPDLPSTPVHNMGAGEQRDLQPVDGENARDDDNVRFNRQHGEQILSRDEPIEGENAGDDVVISSGGGAAAVTTEVADISSVGGDGGSVTAQVAAAAPPPPSTTNVQHPRKETSTGEDSEERDRAAYYKAKSSSRRHEDAGSLRRKPKQHHERYDSESDNSEKRDHRKNLDRSYASERHRGDERDGRRRRGEEAPRDGRRRRGEEAPRHNRSERERRYADDLDRGGGYGRGEERRSKRYNEEEREDRRRTDGDAKRADKERQYRKDRDRDRDDPRRFREKDRRYEYDDERYNRSGSRNTDRSRDPRYGSNAGYGYPQNYGYEHYAYYTQQQQQQMQYYENLRRTNPQAYAEWYRKYYMQASGGAGAGAMPGGVAGGVTGAGMMGQPDIPTDGRESVHSGRSSTNDKERYNHRMSMSTGYFGQAQQAQHYGGSLMDGSLVDNSYGPTSLMSSYSYAQYNTTAAGAMQPRSQVYTPAGYHHQQQQQQQPSSLYSQSDFNDSRLVQQQRQENRMTPFKYTNEHGQVSLSNGLMVCVKPKYSQSGVVNLVKIINVGALAPEFDADRRLLAVYPGPLVRGVTHKKTVIEFCEERLKLGAPFHGAAVSARENSLLRSHANSMTSLCSVTQHSGQQLGQQQQQPFKASYHLLWNLLILLLRQNGTVVGTDIAELLIKNTTEFPATNSNLVVIETVPEKPADKPVAADRAAEGGDASLSDINSEESADDNQLQSAATKSTSNLTEGQITEKFRNYLLYGNVSEALDWATENNLWGHALFLASKMDRRSHLNVMMKFANKLALNDPLQTLYQLMSLRMPSFVTSVVDKKWGDWRPHLAMILSNTSQKPELDRKAITTLGDSLLHNGDVYGSHFCYLMAQVGFGKYEAWTVDSVATQAVPKLVLLGSSPLLRSFKEFATTEAIMMTEIYEYAVTLNDESYMIGEFQPYKFTLATRLLDYGHQLKAFLYMEQLAKGIKRDPQRFDWQLRNNVYVFADRLRYYDPVQEKTMDNNDSQDSDGDHQKWIQELKEMNGQLGQGSGGVQQQEQQQSYYNGNDQHQQPQELQRGYSEPRGSIDKQFTEINQQFNQLNLQYQEYEPQSTDYYGQQNQNQTQAPSNDQYLQPDFSHRETVTDSAGQTEQVPAIAAEGNQYDQFGYQQQQKHDQYSQPPTNAGNFYNPSAYGGGGEFSQPPGGDQSQDTVGGYDYGGYGQQQQQQQSNELQKRKGSAELTRTPTVTTAVATNNNLRNTNTHHAPPPPPLASASYSSSSSAVAAAASRGQLMSQSGSEHLFNGGGGGGSQKLSKSLSPPPSLFDYGRGRVTFNGGDHGQEQEDDDDEEEDVDIDDPVATNWNDNDYDAPRPQISMPSSMSNRPGFYEEDGGDKQQQQQAADNKAGGGKGGGKDSKKEIIGGKGNEQSSGWFGGIFGKLSLKPKNQMILPDDKNPSIVWDPDKKRWINQDEGEVEGEAFKPPPKMSELNLPQQQQQQQQSSPPMGMAPIPTMPSHQQPPMHQGMPPGGALFMGAPAPVPSPMPMMNPGQAVQTMQPAEDGSAVDGGGATRVPTNNLQSNQFKLQRNRTLKKSYVDVFNPSGAPMKAAESIMAPSTVPTVPQGGFFIPGAAVPMMQGQQQQQQQQNFN